MEKTVLAICYDFDKTLSPENMQESDYIPSIKYEAEVFWQEVNEIAKTNDMDQNLAYMYLMADKSRGKVVFNREKLVNAGRSVKLFPGVDSWFERINEYGKAHDIKVEHYVISCGLKEMIEGTSIATQFERIYASSFFYDKDGVAIWPAQVVNYTNKTQFLFRIEKGVLDVNDQKVNDYFKPDKYRVPFRNMVYIGDSDTDIPCMKLVNSNGGHSIGVYDSETRDKSKVFRMLEENRIRYFMPADYREGSQLENLLKEIIDRTATNEVLERQHFACIDEKESETQDRSKEEQIKEDLIDKLDESRSFANTHRLIKELNMIEDWSIPQKERLCQFALNNRQVSNILNDSDVKAFFVKICKDAEFKYANDIKKKFKDEDPI